MTDKHTPTNWNFKHEFAKHYSITHNGYWIGRMRGKENAQLVSAAPDLLEALRQARAEIWRLLDAKGIDPKQARNWPEIVEADAAIAKATGKSL